MEHAFAYILIAWGALNALSRLIPDGLWAKLPEWVKALVRLSRSSGPDTVKSYKQGEVLVKSIVDLLKSIVDTFRLPPPPAALVLVLASALGCSAISEVKHPRHIARGSVLGVAYGVQLADHACAAAAKDMAGEPEDEDEPEPAQPTDARSLPAQGLTRTSFINKPHFALSAEAKAKLDKAISLAKQCDSGYRVARAGILGIAGAVDAWDTIGDKGEIGCGVYQGVTGLREIVNACKAEGVKLPPAVDDAFAAAEFITKFTGASCKRS